MLSEMHTGYFRWTTLYQPMQGWERERPVAELEDSYLLVSFERHVTLEVSLRLRRCHPQTSGLASRSLPIAGKSCCRNSCFDAGWEWVS